MTSHCRREGPAGDEGLRALQRLERAHDGTVLRTYEFRNDEWSAHGVPVPITIGKSGAAWGIGLHEPQGGQQKREGDGRSPAGMFAIGKAFGYAPALMTKLAYQPMTEGDYCIDVNDSPQYNQIVNARTVERKWIEQSSEPMRRDLHANGDQRYEVGFVIEHNPQNVRAAGSCIFGHVWGSPGQTTAGCTAMTKSAMQELVAWLDASRKPIFVLLPQAEYTRLQRSWGLPSLEAK